MKENADYHISNHGLSTHNSRKFLSEFVVWRTLIAHYFVEKCKNKQCVDSKKKLDDSENYDKKLAWFTFSSKLTCFCIIFSTYPWNISICFSYSFQAAWSLKFKKFSAALNFLKLLWKEDNNNENCQQQKTLVSSITYFGIIHRDFLCCTSWK